MPVQSAKGGGKRWGKHGKIYRGKGSKKKAAKQGVAILISQGKIKPKGGAKPSKAHESRGGRAWESIGLAAPPAAADDPNAPRRVDREAGIIRDVCILGPESINASGRLRRRYSLESMREAVPLYEGAMVNIDHPPGHEQGYDRELSHRFGKLINVRFAPDNRVRGDLVANRSHPMFESVFEAAENPLLYDTCGLSHEFDYVADMDDHGVENVSKITRVCSVDLVADPATTRSLFESTNSPPNTREKNMDEDTGAESVIPGMEQVPPEQVPDPTAEVPGKEDEGDGDEFEGSACDAALDEAGEAMCNGEIDQAEFIDKCKMIAKLFGPKDEPEAEEEEGEGEEEGKECQGESESKKPSRRELCSYDEAISTLEKAGAPVKLPFIKAVRGCESKAAREELAAMLKAPEPTATTEAIATGAKPRSGTKPNSIPAHAAESAAEKKTDWDDPAKARSRLYA